MIEVGVEEFAAYDDRFEVREDDVRRIYVAMALKADRRAETRAFAPREGACRV